MKDWFKHVQQTTAGTCALYVYIFCLRGMATVYLINSCGCGWRRAITGTAGLFWTGKHGVLEVVVDIFKDLFLVGI